VKLRIDAAASDEARAAALWYDDQRAGLGGEFLATLDAAIKRIGEDPQTGSRLETLPDAPNVRRLQLRRFPFLIVYEIAGDEVRIVAIAHSRRRPNYWKGRL
jgi:plasmid stabilization system protein ParE